MLRLFVIALITLSFGACKSSREAGTGAGSVVDGETAALVRVIDQDFDFETFASKLKVRITDSAGKSQSASGQIRMVRDSLIWISLRKASIEGVRVLISPDSVKIIDRQAKQYYPASFDYFNKNFGLSITFDDIQRLVVGDILIDAKQADFNRGLDEDQHLLQHKADGLDHTFWIDGTITHFTGMRVSDPASGRLMRVDLDQFAQVDSQTFAQERSIYMTDGQGLDTKLDIDFSGIEVDTELNLPFNVNSKYEVIRQP